MGRKWWPKEASISEVYCSIGGRISCSNASRSTHPEKIRMWVRAGVLRILALIDILCLFVLIEGLILLSKRKRTFFSKVYT